MYLQVYEYLKKKIEEGKYRSGEILPSEYRMAEDFGVSRITMRQALAKLQRENYITRKRSYGTEVIYSPRATRDEQAIAVLVVDITRPFFSEIVRGIQMVLDQKGYKLLLCDTKNINEKEKEYIAKYKDLVGGFIIAPATGNQNHIYYGQLLSEKVPFVFIDRYLPEFNVDAIVSDNEKGGYLATHHLLALGHRRIAVLSEPEATSLLGRIEGYKKALKEYGLVSDEKLIFTGKSRGFENGYTLIQKIVRTYPDVTAAFCLNDDIAWGCLKGLCEVGIKVPEEFSVVGFDNMNFAEKLTPPLTTVNQPKFQIGEKAAEILISRIEKRIKSIRELVSLPVELIIRKSTTSLQGTSRQSKVTKRKRVTSGREEAFLRYR